jgi:beta-lactamase regulating signal transducer with metallopeptidase domain
VTSSLIAALIDANLAGAAGVLIVLALRARTRALVGPGMAYALWLIVPAAMLATLAPPRVVRMAPLSIPATSAPASAPPAPHARLDAATTAPGPAVDRSDVFFVIWLAGTAGSLGLLVIGQRRALRQFGPILEDISDPFLARAPYRQAGPALVGVFHPRLVVPADFAIRFDAAERDLILAHERTHLFAGHALINALTAVVQAVNWFNPLIHLAVRCARVDQELACDAAVVGRFPAGRRTYAQALLKTQLTGATPPLGCAWPAGSSRLLAQRIAMLSHKAPGRFRLRAGAAAIAALTIGAGVGAWSAQPPTAIDDVTQRLAEQEAPRRAVPFDPGRFDKYVGYYELSPTELVTTRRAGRQFFAQLIGLQNVEVYPESETKFFAQPMAIQVSFVADRQGGVTGLVLHQDGLERYAARIDAATADRLAAALAQRIANDRPSAGTEASLRRYILSLEMGRPSYDEMTPSLADDTRHQLPTIEEFVEKAGALKSISFLSVDDGGFDVYRVTFQNSCSVWEIAPLTADGKVSSGDFQPGCGV